MAKDKNSLKEKEYTDRLVEIKWGFNEYYKICFITPLNYSKITKILSEIRRDKDIDIDLYDRLSKIYKLYSHKYYEVKELIHQEPRRHAQLFIGRKKIREFIFKRDCHKCLCCGAKNNLAIDHIHSIFYGGENKLSNLQTLCRRCNSSKSTSYKDYR